MNKKSKNLKPSNGGSRSSIIPLLCIFIVCLSSFLVHAHSPVKMELAYNSVNQKLEVTINHQVANTNSHYIYQLSIKKNADLFNIYNYTSQPDNTKFTYSYSINATEDDIIEVTTLCNQGGSLTRQLTIESGNISSSRNGKSTPGFETFIFILSLIIFLGIAGRKRPVNNI